MRFGTFFFFFCDLLSSSSEWSHVVQGLVGVFRACVLGVYFFELCAVRRQHAPLPCRCAFGSEMFWKMLGALEKKKVCSLSLRVARDAINVTIFELCVRIVSKSQ